MYVYLFINSVTIDGKPHKEALGRRPTHEEEDRVNLKESLIPEWGQITQRIRLNVKENALRSFKTKGAIESNSKHLWKVNENLQHQEQQEFSWTTQ